MYTLRIIDQTPIGAEERRNILFDNEYSVIMKTPFDAETTKEGVNAFENALAAYYGISENTNNKNNIVGFVYVKAATYPIMDYNVVYIVGNEGQTIERIYGIYNKY